MGLFHLIHFRRFLHKNPNLLNPICFINRQFIIPFSTNSPTSNETPPKPTSLSARMSFVFDQIDAIEKERSQKDEALDQIRAWRESKKEKRQQQQQQQQQQPMIQRDESLNLSEVKEKGLMKKEVGVELVHPWPEWIELMERLVQQNYFDIRRKNEDKLILDSGFDVGDDGGSGIMGEVMEEGFDFTRDWKTVQTAGLNFGKDRFDILRSLSRQDIQLLVGYGCPSADKKVVFSAKLLRKHVHLDEGDVCSSCSLRNSCERAYLLTNKEDEARTIDVMRVLMTYGFDPVNGSVVNDSLLKKKRVKAAVRKLLHEVVKLSAIPIDPNLPPPIIKRPPPKVKQTPPPPKRRVGRDDVEMKKGDWLCSKCDFMNFAKNTVCLQCDAKRPKRQLLPGEWECPECQFLNYRRNMACFHCECKRPPDEFTENQMHDRQPGQRSRLDNAPSRKQVSDSWNFDFDENESDGAEVAAFEYADSRKQDQDFSTNRQRDDENMNRPDNNFFDRRPIRPQETNYSGYGAKPGVGFDDFDDEEDDDVNNYELDTKPTSSSVNFSDIDVDSGSEDEDMNTCRPVSSGRNKRVPKSSKRSAFSDDAVDFNSDDDLPVHPNWKSSHVADHKHRNRGKMTNKFGSDDDSDMISGDEDLSDDDFPPKRKSSRINTKSNGYRKVKDEFLDEDDGFSRDNRRVRKTTPDRRKRSANGGFRNDSYEGDRRKSPANGGFRNDSYEGDRKKSPANGGFRNDSYEGDRRKRPANGGFRNDSYDGGGSRGFKSRGTERFGDKPNQRFNKGRGSSGSGPGGGGADSYMDHERFSRPRVNVR